MSYLAAPDLYYGHDDEIIRKKDIAHTSRLTSFIVTVSSDSLTSIDIQNFIEAGLRIIRFQMNFVKRDENLKILTMINTAIDACCEKFELKSWPLAVAIDIPNATIRTGLLDESIHNEEVLVKNQDIVELTTDHSYWNKCTGQRIFMDDSYTFPSIKVGTEIALRFGQIQLVCTEIVSETTVKCQVKREGYLRNGEFLTLRGLQHLRPFLGKNDWDTLQFALDNKFDVIIVNSIRRAATLRKIKDFFLQGVGHSPIVVATICEQEGLNNIDNIMKKNPQATMLALLCLVVCCVSILGSKDKVAIASEIKMHLLVVIPNIELVLKTAMRIRNADMSDEADAIVFCREFLAYEIENINLLCAIQLKIGALCRKKGIPIYISGNVFENTLINGEPNCIEITDATNIVLQGAGMLLRSYRNPTYVLQTIKLLNNISRTAEAVSKSDFWDLVLTMRQPVNAAEGCVLGCAINARQTNSKVIIVLTVSGKSAIMLAQLCPRVVILSVSVDSTTARKMLFYRGIIPLIYSETPMKSWIEEQNARVEYATQYAIKHDMLNYGDNYVVLRKYSLTSSFADSISCWKVILGENKKHSVDCGDGLDAKELERISRFHLMS